MWVQSRQWVLRAFLVAPIFALAPFVGGTAHAGENRPAGQAALRQLTDAGVSFESARVLSGARRVTALEETDRLLQAIPRGDLANDSRAAAALLAGAIRYELGDPVRAEEMFRRAAKGLADGDFADDAAFARIEALEAAGKDLDAAREWPKWEARFPGSPLLSEARLATAWNALRRGKVADAEQLLTTLVATYPWMEKDGRVSLARATVAYLDGRPAEALKCLGTGGPSSATYLRGLCYSAQGKLLKAAASFQEVVDRDPHSPLRDPALFAKANAFLSSRAFRSAGEEFTRVRQQVRDPGLKAEAELRAAASVHLAGNADSAVTLLRDVVERHRGTDVAARAQFLVGEALRAQKQYAAAIPEYNRVLTSYFEHEVAASAQYRVARCLDALGRRSEATSAYQAVVSGYAPSPEAPAAAYLAGVGLLDLKKPLAAAPYFQLVLDRYAPSDSAGAIVFASPSHQELVEAALCLLELSYHRAGNLGQLSGAPHLLLHKMPPSRSEWRAYALLIDADAAAALGRHPEAQATLESLRRDFADHEVGVAANQLLAWTYAMQGRDSLAISTEERMLSRYASRGDSSRLASAYLHMAHSKFNQKRYREAAAAYEDYIRRFPGSSDRLLALYQAGLCYRRLERAGDAVDRWEAIVRDSANAAIAERAWARAGDVYFQAERYTDAKRCYVGLLENFATTRASGIAALRLAQCEYNAGHDAEALAAFAAVAARFPDSPYAREASRGSELSLYRLGQRPDGQATLEKLVEQYPASSFAADAQFQIAQHLYDVKRWHEAAEALRRTVTQYPSSTNADRAQYLLAECHMRAGEPVLAREAYEQFLTFFPASSLRATAQFQLGMMRFEAQEYMQAAVLFTQLVEDSVAVDVRAASLFNLAQCQRSVGSLPEARESLERYGRERPGDERSAEVACQLGDLDETAGDMSAALAHYSAGLAARPKAALAIELQYRSGRCHELLQDLDAALRSYQAAAAAPDKDDAFRLSALARCATLYESRGQKTRAAEAYRDIARHAKDAELATAASERAKVLLPRGATEDAAPAVPARKKNRSR